MKKRYLFLYALLALVLFSFGYIKYYNMNINDIGLGVLGWVKKIRGQGVKLDKIANQNTSVIQHHTWSVLLEKHVHPDGVVNYEGFRDDRSELDEYLDLLSNNPPGKNWTTAEQLAYWINAYNAFTVQLILDHYPLKSIKDISEGLPMINSPWDIKFFNIGGIDFDLNTIEHEILRKRFEEPRIHFAINCASFSCPKLRNEAFTADHLEKQLDDQASSFINNQDKNIITPDETKLSKIFEWFESDFTKDMNLLSYIHQYSQGLNLNNKIEYLPYRWELNN